jgi:hypothetical protein
MFLIKMFNKNRLLQGNQAETQFYKQNDFSNVLEYFVDR